MWFPHINSIAVSKYNEEKWNYRSVMKKRFSGLCEKQQVPQLPPLVPKGLAAWPQGQLWHGAAIPWVKAAMRQSWEMLCRAGALRSGAEFQLRTVTLGPGWARLRCADAQRCTSLLLVLLTCLQKSPQICPSPQAGLAMPWLWWTPVTIPVPTLVFWMDAVGLHRALLLTMTLSSGLPCPHPAAAPAAAWQMKGLKCS